MWFFNKYKSLSGLSVGEKATVKGIELELVAALQYEEEGGTKWEEWMAKSGSKVYWLEFDPYYDHFVLYEQLEVPSSLTASSIVLNKEIQISERDSFTIKEIGTGRLIDFTGKLPWHPEKGEVVNYYDNGNAPVIYSIEIQDGEIEVFKGSTISKSEVESAFASRR